MGMGDEVMATGDAARLFRQTKKKVIVLDRNDRARYHDLFRGNPKIHEPTTWVGSLRDHPLVRSGPGRRPYADYQAIENLGRRKNPQAETSKELRRAASRLMFNYDYRAEAGEIHIGPEERGYADRAVASLGSFVIIEPNIKGRTPAKQWGLGRWQDLADELSRRGRQPIQIGAGAGIKLTNVRYIKTPTFRVGMAVMDLAQTFIVPEGGLHHGFAALHKRGVALFAGRTPLILSYPDQLTWFIEHKGGPCGFEHIDCSLCRKLWNDLTVSDVLAMLDRC